MKNLKRMIAIVIVLALCFALASCGRKNDDTAAEDEGTEQTEEISEQTDDTDLQEEENAQEDSADDNGDIDLNENIYEYASGLSASDAAITINGEEISYEFYMYWLAYDCYYLDYMYSMYGMYLDLTDPDLSEFLLEDACNVVIYYALIDQLCEELGVSVTDEQWAELQDQIDQYIEDYGEEEYELLVKGYGSEETLRTVNTSSYQYYNLADAIVGDPTDEEIDEYYEENGTFHVKHILLMTTDTDITDEDGNVIQTAEEYNADQLKLAEDLLKQIQESSDQEATFDSLMNQYSEDTGLETYPDGYTYDDSSSLVEGFREASLELEIGEVSGIVETSYGYHIILRLPVDFDIFLDDWIADQVDMALQEMMDASEIIVSDEIFDIDVDSFYSRYVAYSNALWPEG